MTKFPLPLIIKLVLVLENPLGVGGQSSIHRKAARRRKMRVYVYKLVGGGQAAMVVASVGRGMPPVLLPAVTRENIKELIRPVIDAMRGPRGPEGPVLF